jgi:RND family efflux transporter MFP subunit
MKAYRWTFVPVLVLAVGACDRSGEHGASVSVPAVPAGEFIAVASRTIPAALEASGTAKPFAEATLSTKLMGTVLSVHVQEGSRVRRGDVLLALDARDLDARAAQVEASLAEAEAIQREAVLHAERMRMLFAEDAAPKVQLDAAETALARARAGIASAHGAAAELRAMRAYAVVRAPFDGTVVRRMVDRGAFASPGAPLLVVQDAQRLRIVVTAAPDAVRALERGATVAAFIEGEKVEATIEGVVPAGGSLYTVNAIVDNAAGAHLAGSAATLLLPVGERTALFVPRAAVHRQGDMSGIYVAAGGTATLRWIRPGAVVNDSIEVLAGLRDGDRVLVPTTVAGAN